MQIQLPHKVCYIIETIQAAGYEAYAVGGCIRDCVLLKKPDDWDITTSAEPEVIKELFDKTIDTGIKHGTVTVMLEKEGFEVTTYRIDGEYTDGRHPENVTFVSDLAEDLRRRDFTVNAMAYNEKAGLIDLFGGMEDIHKGVIRCVGDAKERFNEDALRMMRAVRFCAQLGYVMEEKTGDAIKELAPAIKNISVERIQTELVKLLMSDHPDYLRIAYETGLTAYFIPEFDECMQTGQNNPHHDYNVGEHILHSLNHIRSDKVLRLTMLFHDIGKPQTLSTDEDGITHNYGHARVGEEITGRVLKRLKFDNDTIYKVKTLVKYHDRKGKTDAESVKRLMNQMGGELMPLLFCVQYADIMAQSSFKREEKLNRLEEFKAAYKKILERKECYSLKDLAVTGNDLIEMGMKSGREIGETLSKLLDIVLAHPEFNNKDYLLSGLPFKD